MRPVGNALEFLFLFLVGVKMLIAPPPPPPPPSLGSSVVRVRPD